jgi:uncharacterized membrane protein
VNRKLISLATALAVMVTSTAVAAQAPSQLQSKADHSVGPTVAASTAGIRAPSQARSLNASGSRDAHMGAGTNVALMVVGGAALIVGAIIGGTAGILIAVAGAAVGLYGLYYFIQ